MNSATARSPLPVGINQGVTDSTRTRSARSVADVSSLIVIRWCLLVRVRPTGTDMRPYVDRPPLRLSASGSVVVHASGRPSAS